MNKALFLAISAAVVVGCAGKDAKRWSLYECAYGARDGACAELSSFEGRDAEKRCLAAAKTRPGSSCYYETE